jgi:hypothetical protein
MMMDYTHDNMLKMIRSKLGFDVESNQAQSEFATQDTKPDNFYRSRQRLFAEKTGHYLTKKSDVDKDEGA